MRPWAERLTVALLVCGAATYVAAKVHFFTRFDANDIDTYVAEHWPFWIALSIIAALVLVVGRVGRSSRGRGGE